MSQTAEPQPEIKKGQFADVMPDMSDEEFSALKRSIEQDGLRHPIEITGSGEIVDGHHRFKACRELGIEPETVVVEDASVEQAIRANFTRRNLGDGSKREVVKEYLKYHWLGERTQKQIAEELGVDPGTVTRAKQDLEKDGIELNFNHVPADEKPDHIREYIDENPDASNRDVADSVDFDVSRETVRRVRNKLEAGELDESDGSESAETESTESEPSVNGSDTSEPTMTEGRNEPPHQVETETTPEPSQESDSAENEPDALDRLAQGEWDVDAIREAFERDGSILRGSVLELLVDEADDVRDVMKWSENLDSLTELPEIGEKSERLIEQGLTQLEARGVSPRVLKTSADSESNQHENSDDAPAPKQWDRVRELEVQNEKLTGAIDEATEHLDQALSTIPDEIPTGSVEDARAVLEGAV